MRLGKLIVTFTSLLSSASLIAQTVTQEGENTAPIIYGVTPEGKTLPEGIARFRFPIQILSGDKSFDGSGKESEAIVKLNATAGSFVAEYGISDRLSFQLQTNYVISQKIQLNSGSTAYKDLKAATFSSATGGASNTAELSAAVRAKVIANFKAANACTSDENCAAAYDSGSFVTQAEGSVISGTSSVAAGTPYKDAVPTAANEIDALVTQGIKNKGESEGGTSLGDTNLGLLYEVYTEGPLMVSIAGGLRFPTGSRDLANNELTATRGAYELGGRFNLDLLPRDWMMISWQNQSELGIAASKKKVGGVEGEYSRRGLRNLGFVLLKPSLSYFSAYLNGLKSSLGVSYDYDSASVVKVGDLKITSDRPQQMWAYLGLGIDLLNQGIPLRADFEYEKPISGKNVIVAVAKTTITLKAFAKF